MRETALIAAVIAEAIKEVCTARDDKWVLDWRTSSAAKWIFESQQFEDFCDMLRWDVEVVREKLRAKIDAGWVYSGHSSHGLDVDTHLPREDVERYHVDSRFDGVVPVHRSAYFNPLDYVGGISSGILHRAAAGVRELNDMDQDERLALLRRYWDRGIWAVIEPCQLW